MAPGRQCKPARVSASRTGTRDGGRNLSSTHCFRNITCGTAGCRESPKINGFWCRNSEIAAIVERRFPAETIVLAAGQLGSGPVSTSALFRPLLLGYDLNGDVLPHIPDDIIAEPPLR